MNLTRDPDMEDDKFSATATVDGEPVQPSLVGVARGVRDYEVPFGDGPPAEVTVRYRRGVLRGDYLREVGRRVERPLRLDVAASTSPEQAFEEGVDAEYVFRAPRSRRPFTFRVTLPTGEFDSPDEMPAACEHYTPVDDPLPALHVGDEVCITTTTRGSGHERSLPVQIEGTVVSIRDYRADDLPVEVASVPTERLFEATVAPADDKVGEGSYHLILETAYDAIEADIPEGFGPEDAGTTPVDITPEPPFPPSVLDRKVGWHGEYGHTSNADVRHIEVQNREATAITDWFAAQPDAPQSAEEARRMEETDGPPSVEQVAEYRDRLRQVFEAEQDAGWLSIDVSPEAAAKAVHAIVAGEAYPGGPPTVRVAYESKYSGTDKEVEGDVLGVTMHVSRSDDLSIHEAPRVSLDFGSKNADDTHRIRLDADPEKANTQHRIARPSSGAGLGVIHEAELSLGAHDLRELPDGDETVEGS
jgi:hypothetical protein